MNTKILGLGEACVDWVATIDHFPEPDEKIDSNSQNIFGGGVTANYVVAAARLGANSSFVGAVGEDSYGTFLKNDFLQEKVGIDNLMVNSGQETPVNFIFVVEKSGEKVIIQSPYMQTTKPSLTDMNADIFQDAQLLHTTGIHLEVTAKAFQLAKENDVAISFDLEKQIAIRGVEKLRPLLEQVDFIMPNKAGAMQLTQTNNPTDAAKVFLKWGISEVIITLGNEGSIAITADEQIKVPARKIKPVDTTGAGDTYCAAFGYSHTVLGRDLHDSCMIANVASGFKILKLGARTGMPSMKDVKAYIEENNIKLNNPL